MRRAFITFCLGVGCFSAALPASAISFNLSYDASMSSDAIAGFTAAANLWSGVLGDDITINIQVGYVPLAPGIIGSTASAWYGEPYTDFAGALATHRTSADDYTAVAHLPTGDTYSRWINYTSDNPNGVGSATPFVDSLNWVGVTSANAKTLGLAPAHDTAVDGSIVFSSLFTYDFAHGTNIAPGAIDFVGAAAHEIGHVLGFVSGVDDIDVLASTNGLAAGTDYSNNAIDFFRYSALSLSDTNHYNDYTAGPSPKYFSLDGGVTALTNFSTGTYMGDGRQASHWIDVSPSVGLMDPTGGYGEYLSITPTDLVAFDVLGYTVIPEPSTVVLTGVFALAAWARRRRFRHRGFMLTGPGEAVERKQMVPRLVESWKLPVSYDESLTLPSRRPPITAPVGVRSGEAEPPKHPAIIHVWRDKRVCRHR